MRAATILLLLLAALQGCAVTVWERDGQPVSQRDLMECNQEGLKATAGQMSMAAAFSHGQILRNCIMLRGYRPVR